MSKLDQSAYACSKDSTTMHNSESQTLSGCGLGHMYRCTDVHSDLHVFTHTSFEQEASLSRSILTYDDDRPNQLVKQIKVESEFGSC